MISIHPVLRTRISKNLLHPMLLFCFCFFKVITYGQANVEGIAGKNFTFADTASSPRQIIPFDDNWRFFLGDNPAAKDAAFDDSHWRIFCLMGHCFRFA